MLSYAILKTELSGAQKARADSYLNSPLYYLLTGRKGAWLYKNAQSALVVCAHPHVENRLMVFPEIGRADYELTAAVLDTLAPLGKSVQLARYTEEDVRALRRRLAEVTCSPVAGIAVTEEKIADWRYPVRILDTETVAAMKGADFVTVRNKFRRAAQAVSCVPLSPENGLRFMKAALKFWEGNMIFNAKETADMTDFYTELFNITAAHPAALEGLFFLQGRKPLGFSVWDRPRGDTANLLVNLADTSVTGLSDYQMVSACRALREADVRALNLGGSETRSLDAFKAKYRPAQTLRILSADIAYRTPEKAGVEVHTLVAGRGG